LIDDYCVEIRRASISDLEDLIELLRELFAFEADFTFDAEIQRRGLEMMLADTENRCVLAAHRVGKVVGMCTAQIVVSTAEGGPAGLVEDLVVCQEWRGTGVGRRLAGGIEQWARSKGATRLQLLADRKNDNALGFYKKAGWRRTQLICLRRKTAPFGS